MAITGLFTQARPTIGGRFFDAVLEESSELLTEITEFPIETGNVGNDHAIQRPLTLTMRVGISDNKFRALREAAGDVGGPLVGPIAGNAASTALGGVIGSLSAEIATAAGLGFSVANAAFAAGQEKTRSETALSEIREIQRRNQKITVVASKRQYENMMITATRQETNKENEQSLDLVVEMQQLITVGSTSTKDPIPAPNDPAATQCQPETDLGLVALK